VKATALVVFCLALAVGLGFAVRRAIERITAPPRARPLARRGAPASTAGLAAGEQVLQQLTRFRTAGGYEAIRGTLLAEFAVGQREASVHVAFCPPFERLPEVEAHAGDDSAADVKVTQRLHHGAQLDVRLARPAQLPHAVSIEFFAAEPGPAGVPAPSICI
jgi:hypothetical protein